MVLAGSMALFTLLGAFPGLGERWSVVSCQDMRITGYVRSEFSSRTYDGTPIGTSEPIVAASWWIPIDSLVEVDGLGTFRVADRGQLGPAHIDVAVWTRAEAYALTGTRRVCVYPP